jgi:serine/threonine protein kinase
VIDEGEVLVGRYRLVSRLGAGAMGVVWKAYDERLHRVVAVKQLLRAGMSEVETEEANRRVMREGRITARLHHPHAITVYDVAEQDGTPCLVMEYLHSKSLSTVLAERGPLPPAQVARIGSQIASALAAAHEAGIVHRDIKPGNVLLAEDGTAKITDFGISRAVGDSTVTGAGILAGTPAYLAPEVAQGQKAGFAADVFSLGATLYAAVEGVPPFGLGDNPLALVFRIANSEITPPRQSGSLTPVLAWLLDRDPARRPAMQQAQDALATIPAAPGIPVIASGPPTVEISALPAPDPLTTAAPHPETGVPPATSALAGDTPTLRRPTVGVRRTRRSAVVIAAAAGALLLVGVLLVAALINNGSNTPGPGAGPPSTTPATAQSQPPPQPSPPAATTAAAPPILTPSPAPSSAPRPQPSSVPSPQPSPAPSPQPSSEPSSEPSPQPSSEPSPQPSSEPSPPTSA